MIGKKWLEVKDEMISYIIVDKDNIDKETKGQRKRKMKESKEKRLRERELRKKYDYESVGDDHDN